ncbi:synaptotagmin-like protein 4 isoform X2 [Antennarius striatus]|uniref:synaptotagmin-like protein 4 isoform X2 n=1 Tax=Antennarius striatus TaxID=241820 RepID=UPI0035AFE3AB
MPQAGETINLGFLSDSEQELILEVLRRDEELRLAEEKRVRKLKTDFLEVKRKGAKRGSGKYRQNVCGRCLEPLSRLTFASNQCKMCNHHVCRKCRTALPEGSWLCSVCAKESNVKKMTGDWFYDQRINRFSAAPVRDLIRVSMRKRSQSNRRETTGEILLRSNELPVNTDPPVPVPQARKPKQTSSNKNPSNVNSGSLASSETLLSDTESVENISLRSSKTDPESGRNTPQHQSRARRSVQYSSPGSSVSSNSIPFNADMASIDGPNTDTNSAHEVRPVSQTSDLDVDKLFKKSIKRDPRSNEYVSTQELYNGDESSKTSMGSRCKSAPGLDIQEGREEEEDIDSLVNFHKRKMASSSSSLQSSKSTMGSLMSVYSEAGDFDTVDVTGEVVFSMRYDDQSQSLQIFIEECHDLACGDAARQTSNPYVKCYLLPDKSRQSKRKTSAKRNTLNPVYKETLKYSINRSKLFTRSVLISVWHHGRLSRNAFLGEVEIALDCRDLSSPFVDCVPLMGKSPSTVSASAFAQYKGDLVISLKYITPKNQTTVKHKGKKVVTEEMGEMHILVKEASHLMPMSVGGTLDSFVKGYLYPAKGKTTKKKTPVVKKNLNPHYDHIFVYKGLSLEQLKDMCLELTVWDKEAMLSNEFLGGVRLSCGKGTVKIGKEEVELDSVGEEVSLWQKMMQYPDSWAEGTLPLRSTMKTEK